MLHIDSFQSLVRVLISLVDRWFHPESRTSSMEHRATQPRSQGHQGDRAHHDDDSIDCVVVVDLAPSERALVLDL